MALWPPGYAYVSLQQFGGMALWPPGYAYVSLQQIN